MMPVNFEADNQIKHLPTCAANNCKNKIQIMAWGKWYCHACVIKAKQQILNEQKMVFEDLVNE